jgi:hypothetical protein
MEIRNSLLEQVFECGYLDMEFYIRLCEENSIDVDVDDCSGQVKPDTNSPAINFLS